MFTLTEQKERYKKQWNKFSKDFENNNNLCVEDPIAIYVIGIHLHSSLYDEMEGLSDQLKLLHKPKNSSKDQWLKPHRMHITLELPGRIGKHFQEDEIPFIKETLRKITQSTSKFSVQLGNINCFPSVLFREVYDKNNNIYKLHNKIAKELPFSEHVEYRFEKFIPHMSIVYLGGGGHNSIINHKSFNKKLDFQDMKVEKLYFLKVSDAGYIYKEDMIAEFHLQ